jgi:preprotein translocase subunit SecA
MNGALKRILGDPQAKTIKRLKKRVRVINDLAPKYEKMSDDNLRAQTEKLRGAPKKKNHLTLFCPMLLLLYARLPPGY